MEPRPALGLAVGGALLSVGEALAASVIAGSGGEVRAPRLHWRRLWPHFRIDATEAALCGPNCERTVALVRLTPMLAGAAAAAWYEPTWLAPVLAGMFYLLAPTPRSAARRVARRPPRLQGVHRLDRLPVRAPPEGPLARFRVWWSGRTSRFGMLWIAWGLIGPVSSVSRCSGADPG